MIWQEIYRFLEKPGPGCSLSQDMQVFLLQRNIWAQLTQARAMVANVNISRYDYLWTTTSNEWHSCVSHRTPGYVALPRCPTSYILSTSELLCHSVRSPCNKLDEKVLFINWSLCIGNCYIYCVLVWRVHTMRVDSDRSKLSWNIITRYIRNHYTGLPCEKVHGSWDRENQRGRGHARLLLWRKMLANKLSLPETSMMTA